MHSGVLTEYQNQEWLHLEIPLFKRSHWIDAFFFGGLEVRGSDGIPQFACNADFAPHMNSLEILCYLNGAACSVLTRLTSRFA